MSGYETLTPIHRHPPHSVKRRIVVYADIETVQCTEELTAEGHHPERMVLGFYEVRRYDAIRDTPTTIEEGFFYNPIEFLGVDGPIQRHLSDLPQYETGKTYKNGEPKMKDYSLVVFFYNANFDMSALRMNSKSVQSTCHYIISQTSGVNFSPVKTKPSPLYKKVEFGLVGKSCYFVDIAKIFPVGSLEQNMKNFGCQTVKEELHRPTWSEYKADQMGVRASLRPRCKNDVIGLRECCEKLWSNTYKAFGCFPNITTAEFALRAFRSSKEYRTYEQHCKENNIPLPICPSEERAVNALDCAYLGGKTEAYFRGRPHGKTMQKYDYNSMYPYNMLKWLPTVLEGILTKQEEMLSYIKMCRRRKGMTYFVQVDLNVPKEYKWGGCGIICNGKLIFPCGKICGAWIYAEEYEHWYAKGFVTKRHELHKYRAAPILREFILKCYDLRLNAKRRGDIGLANTYKMVMNALSGKFGAKDNGKWVVPTKDQLEDLLSNNLQNLIRTHPDQEWGLDLETGLYLMDRTQDEKLLVYNPPSKTFADAAVPQIVAAITSMGRIMMLKSFEKIDSVGGDSYYCDTDSIITDITLEDFDLTRGLVHQTELGKLKWEGSSTGDKCFFWAPKQYQFDGNLVCKGVKVGDKWEIDDNGKIISTTTQFKGRFDGQHKGANARDFANREYGNYIIEITKNISGLNQKRQVIGDGQFTKPLEGHWVATADGTFQNISETLSEPECKSHGASPSKSGVKLSYSLGLAYP